MDNLNMSFQISKIRKEPEEITMFRFMENLEDARRREYSTPISKIVEKAGVWVWDYWNCRDDRTKYNFEFREIIVPEKKATGSALYDQGFLDELANI
ncbi:MAG: hypothetical protein K6G81_02425 [Lachnospiraceae bacterium]|nr:hypothetical protein [Lachnospiraceae bacterium]